MVSKDWLRATLIERLITALLLIPAPLSAILTPQGPQIRDSAGIRVVTNSLPRWGAGEGWWIDPVPEVTIGVADGEDPYLLYNVLGATVLGDGTIVLAQFGRSRFDVRYFSSSGRFIRAVGRFGNGPFEMARGLAGFSVVSGDSVLVVGDDHRFMVLGPAGERARTGRVDVPYSWLRTQTLDASHLGIRRSVGPLADGWAEDSSAFAIFDLETGEVEELGTIRGPRYWGRVNVGTYPSPLSFRVYEGAGAGTLWVGRSDTYAIRGYSTEGRLTKLVRNTRPLEPVTRAIRETYIAKDLEGRSGEQLRRVQEHHARMAFPDDLPAFRGLTVDALGNLWVRHYDLRWAEDDYRWDVYDPRGAWLGIVNAPQWMFDPCFRERDLPCWSQFPVIGEDFILVKRHDDLGVERIDKHRLVKGGE